MDDQSSSIPAENINHIELDQELHKPEENLDPHSEIEAPEKKGILITLQNAWRSIWNTLRWKK